jgi:hypothetical protein
MTLRELHEPPPAILVVAAMWRPGLLTAASGDEAAALISLLEPVFGKTATTSPAFPFNYSDYYREEMGEGLRKIFVAFEALHPRGSLVAHKRASVALEHTLLDDQGHRVLNADPMLVTMENVVIATSKNFTHRVYLGEGVFADLALIRRKGGFEPLPWTYKDYSDHSGFFGQERERLKQLLRDKFK